jgi:hypothetical protein
VSLVVSPGDPGADSYASIEAFDSYWSVRGGIPAGVGIVGGTAIFTLAILPIAGETVTLDGITYIYVDTLSGAAYEVLIGSTIGEARANLSAAVAGDEGAWGVTTGVATLPHPTMTMLITGSLGSVTSRAIGSTGDGLAVADTLTAPNGFGATTETAGGTSSVEVALRASTSWIDGQYRQEWKGVRTYETQRLDHPREDMYFEGFALSSTAIHESVVDATCLLAGKDTSGQYADTAAQTQQTTSISLERSKLGPLEKETRYHSASEGVATTDTGRYPEVEALLAPVLDYESDSMFLRS